jgi:small conductance mechanosensitive channel
MNTDINGILTTIKGFSLEYGPKLIGAIIVWIIGSFIIKKIIKAFEHVLDKQKTDASL